MPSFPLTNFKSVMLSDRPQANLDAKGKVKSTIPPFKSMVRATKVEAGLNRPKDIKVVRAKDLNPKLTTNKGNDAITRHKRWLKELQAMNALTKEINETKNADGAVKARRFKENQAVKRELLRTQKEEATSQLKALQAVQEEVGYAGPPDNSSKGKGKGKGKGKAKPKWAMTEDALEGEEEDEMEDLVNFAECLDFDRFIDDYEVRQAMEVVKRRVKELEKEEDEFEWVDEEYSTDEEAGEPGADYDGDGDVFAGLDGGDEDGFGAAPPRRRVVKVRRVRRRKQPGADSITVTDDAPAWGAGHADESLGQRKVAGEVLQSSRSMRSVHSKASIQAMMARKNAEGSSIGKPLIPVDRATLDAARAANAGGADAAERAGVNVSNLPYLHRNPAV